MQAFILLSATLCAQRRRRSGCFIGKAASGWLRCIKLLGVCAPISVATHLWCADPIEFFLPSFPPNSVFLGPPPSCPFGSICHGEKNTHISLQLLAVREYEFFVLFVSAYPLKWR